jgi:hypothetical protein
MKDSTNMSRLQDIFDLLAREGGSATLVADASLPLVH